MVHGILFIQLTCLTVLMYNLFPGLLWSSPWSWTLAEIFGIRKLESLGYRVVLFV